MRETKPNDLEQAIEAALRRLADVPESGRTFGSDRTELTKSIKAALRKLATDRGYVWYPSEGLPDRKEWLLDGVAYRPDPKNGKWYLPFIVECEWDTTKDAIAYDFQKLIVTRSENRVMIFRQGSSRAADTMIDYLISWIDTFREGGPGDRYFFACFCNDIGKFAFRRYSVE